MMLTSKITYAFLITIVFSFTYSCKQKNNVQSALNVQPEVGSEYQISTKVYTHLERRTRDAMLAMNLVGNIDWSLGFSNVNEDTIDGFFKLNAFRSNLETTSPSTRTYEINTMDTTKTLYGQNSKPYATLLKEKHRFVFVKNRAQIVDSSYFKLAEALPSAHQEDLVSEQFFLLFRDQAIEAYLEHVLSWHLPDTVSGSRFTADLRVFQGLTLEVNDTLQVKTSSSSEIDAEGKGGLKAWNGLHGVDGILSKKNKANGQSDIYLQLDAKSRIPIYVNIHLRASGEALNYQTMYPFKLEADIKHTLKRVK